MEKEGITKLRRKQSYRNPRHYRLEFFSENTFNRVWSIRMTSARLWIVSAAFFASVCALILVIVLFTPVRDLLPMKMERDVRARYLDAALRLDSLEQVVRANNAYIGNIIDIMEDKIPESSPVSREGVSTGTDSLPDASEAERKFVQQYESAERFNLSVLSPIAAEGMVFYSPAGGVAPRFEEDENGFYRITSGRVTPATSVYRGTVVAAFLGENGLWNIMLQHPNDFVSVYRGMSDIFVSSGTKVAAGQRIGQTPSDAPLGFALWHSGVPLDPEEYTLSKSSRDSDLRGGVR